MNPGLSVNVCKFMIKQFANQQHMYLSSGRRTAEKRSSGTALSLVMGKNPESKNPWSAVQIRPVTNTHKMKKVNSSPIFATQFATVMLVWATVTLRLCYGWRHKSLF